MTPIQISIAFEWPNEDPAFVAELRKELEAFGVSVAHRTSAQQPTTTMHGMKLAINPAIAGPVLETIAGVSEAGADVVVEMSCDETGG